MLIENIQKKPEALKKLSTTKAVSAQSVIIHPGFIPVPEIWDSSSLWLFGLFGSSKNKIHF